MSKGNKKENKNFTNAEMLRENVSPPLKDEGGQTTYDEVINATFFSLHNEVFL